MTLTPISSYHHDILSVDRFAQAVPPQVRDRPVDELRDVLDADDLARGVGVGHEVVEQRDEVARARADVKDARSGFEEREEVLDRVRMLYTHMSVRARLCL